MCLVQQPCAVDRERGLGRGVSWFGIADFGDTAVVVVYISCTAERTNGVVVWFCSRDLACPVLWVVYVDPSPTTV